MAELQQIMTRNVTSITSEQSVSDAATVMRQYNVGAVPVLQNGQCVGIITDRDISLRTAANGVDADTTPVESVMSKEIITGDPKMDVHEAANLMAKNQIRRVPVVDNNHLIGMVSLGDMSVQNIYENEAGQALSDISYPASPRNPVM
ncbi:MAG: CBS domain-containing protein [Clostridiales bacterium]|nr:CBS domain-containing protein [Clostridiales bacterium]MCF8023443.1 CBS domain-containing protein [Clostridiales bacterium]